MTYNILRVACGVLVAAVSSQAIGETKGAALFIKGAEKSPAEQSVLASTLDFQPNKILSGSAALSQLKAADMLDDHAKQYGIDQNQLERILKTDPTVFLDKAGQIFYKEAKPHSFSQTSYSQTINSKELNDYPLSEAFSLNSRPESTRVIYLNFKGARITNTSWNDSYGKTVIDAAPFDTDGNPNSFSNAERAEIIARWRLVAEAYAQYDINVTTVEQTQDKIFKSDVADVHYGVVAHITPDWTANTSTPCRCGGFAYLSAFNGENNRIRDNFNFNWANSNNARGSSGTIIHEVGHNLGLNHDGTATATYYAGHGSGEHTWAPYMGNGYYSEVAHFNNGDYPGATNKEDDFAIMTSRGAILTASGKVVVNSQSGVSEFKGRAILNNGNNEYHFLVAVGAGTSQWKLSPSIFGRSVAPTVTVKDEATDLTIYEKPVDVSRNHSFSINTPVDKTYRLIIKNSGYKTSMNGGYSAYGSTGEFVLEGTFGIPTDDVFIYSSDEKYESLSKVSEFIGDRPSGDGKETYSWSFSDGTGYRGKSIKKQFISPGTYTLTLTVKGSNGYLKSTTRKINVKAPFTAG